MSNKNFTEKRKKLVKSLILRGYISSKEVIEAMNKVPRHLFVGNFQTNYAYEDRPLSIGEGQTISAPHMVGIMAEKLDLIKGLKILEIGTGCGYHAAVIATIIGDEGHIYTIERIEKLADKAKENLKKVGLEKNVSLNIGDGSLGLKEFSPYDRILVTCGAPEVPKSLIEQLVDGGKLLVPVGGRYLQDLIYLEKKGEKIIKKKFGGVAFVPLIGAQGF